VKRVGVGDDMVKGWTLLVAAIVLVLAVVYPVYADGYPLTISNVATKNYDGETVTSFSKGELALIEVTVTYPSTYYYYYGGAQQIQCLIIVEVFDPSNVVRFLFFKKTTLSQGESFTTGWGFKIPYGAQSGTWTVKVFVWNKFISELAEGEAHQILAESVEKTFTVG